MMTSLRNAVLWVLPAVLALFAPTVMALGLGNATVESWLNQPLQARIELLTRPGEDLSAVTAGLASAEDFALIGASREAISVPLRFAIEQDGTGASVRVSSSLPVKEPIIRLIVEVNWPNGRMLREYTLFLDPPTVDQAAPPPVIDERQGRAPEAAVAPAVAAPAADTGETAAAAGSSVAAGIREDAYGPVRRGETLWSIASAWAQGSGLSVNQVMLAIQRNNPGAFINDNINLLMRGAILRMPSVDDVAAVSPEAARAEVIQQNEVWSRSPAASAATAAVETPLVADVPEAREPEDAGPAPDEHLEIVPPLASEQVDSAYGTAPSAEDAEASVSAEVLREELARAEEELIGERQENEYLRDRVAELEQQLAADDRATVADSDLAGMESRLREERQAEAETAAPAVPQVSSTPRPAAGQPWYRSMTVWVILVLVLGAALAGWGMSRRPAAAGLPAFDQSEDGTVRGIAGEAEEILRVLKPGAAKEEETPAESAVPAAGPVAPAAERRRPGDLAGRDEAELLDEDSEDPEVRLDLARAYVAMGDREAARVILEEVMEHGDEAQQAEARSMLDEL